MTGPLGFEMVGPVTRLLALGVGESFGLELWVLVEGGALLMADGETDFDRLACTLRDFWASRILSVLVDFRTAGFLSTRASEDLLLLVRLGFLAGEAAVPLRTGKVGGGEVDTGDL